MSWIMLIVCREANEAGNRGGRRLPLMAQLGKDCSERGDMAALRSNMT